MLSLGPQAAAAPGSKPTDVSARHGDHLGIHDTIGDLLRHPALAGFAPLILPWDDRAYDEDLPLARIGSLLPYHTHIDPETITSALNRMIDDVAAGKTVFYRFYSDAQTAAAAREKQHGFVLLPGSPRCAIRGHRPGRRIRVCRLGP